MRSSYSAIVERNIEISGPMTTEPYECGWAGEAVFFVRILEGNLSEKTVNVQISPDGMNWCDEGTHLELPASGQTSFAKVTHFGNWLRLAGDMGDRRARILVTLHLKE